MSKLENYPHHTGPLHAHAKNKYFFTDADFSIWEDNDGTNGRPLIRWLSPGRLISIAQTTFPPGTSSGLHADEEQMVVILEGRIELEVDDGFGPDHGVHRKVLGPGDAWYVPPEVFHHARVLDQPAKVIAIFVPAFIGRSTYPDRGRRSGAG